MKGEEFCVQGAEGGIIDEVVEPVEDLSSPDVLLAADAEEVSAGERLSARAEVPSGSTDARGLGTEAFP